MTPYKKRVVNELQKYAAVAQEAQKAGRDMTPLDVAKIAVNKKIGAMKNYLQQNGENVRNLENAPIEETAARVNLTLLRKTADKVREKELSIRNNAPVIDNNGADVRTSDLSSLPEAERTGLYYGGGVKPDPYENQGGGVKPDPYENGGESLDEGAQMSNLSVTDSGVLSSIDMSNPLEIRTAKAEDEGGYFELRDGVMYYLGSGLVPASVALEEVLKEHEEDTGFSGNPDMFLGDIIGAVAKVGQAALVKINDKREEKGKKPILKVLEGNARVTTEIDPDYKNYNVGDAARVAAERELAALKDKEKKAEIKKMMPMIIIGVVILIVVVALIARKTK